MRGSSKKPIINENIDADQVRLIGADGGQVGIVGNIEHAREAAAEAKLDLVMISPRCGTAGLQDHGLREVPV